MLEVKKFKKLSLILTAILIVSFIFSVVAPAFASNGMWSRFAIGQKTYTVNGETRAMDAAPFIKGGRVFLPIRYAAYAVGVPNSGVVWDAKTRTVTITKGSDTIALAVGSPVLKKNGSPVKMDAAPFTKDGRVFLPLRYVGEAFGAKVDWNEAARTVTLIIGDATPPPVQPPANGVIDMTAARNGTLQPPANALDPPSVWGFEPKALRVEFKVGSRYAKVRAYTPEMAELDWKIKAKLDELRYKYDEWFWSDANPDRSGGMSFDDEIPNGKRFQKWYQNNRDPEFDNLLVQRQKLTEGSVYTLDLGTPCVIVGNPEGIEHLKKNYPNVYNSKNTVPVPGMKTCALYAPFIPVAEALGVPRENIVWDGQHLAVFGFDGAKEGYMVFEAGSTVPLLVKWNRYGGVVDEWELTYPLYVKDGVPMLGINSVCDFDLLLSGPGAFASIVDLTTDLNGALSYENGMAAVSGKRNLYHHRTNRPDR